MPVINSTQALKLKL